MPEARGGSGLQHSSVRYFPGLERKHLPLHSILDRVHLTFGLKSGRECLSKERVKRGTRTSSCRDGSGCSSNIAKNPKKSSKQTFLLVPDPFTGSCVI